MAMDSRTVHSLQIIPIKTSMCRVSQCLPAVYVWLLGKFAGQAMQKAKEERIEHHKNSKLPPLRASGHGDVFRKTKPWSAR